MNMWKASCLEFHPITVLRNCYLAFSTTKEDILDETFDSCIKESRYQKGIVKKKVMITLSHVFIDIVPKFFTFNHKCVVISIPFVRNFNLVPFSHQQTDKHLTPPHFSAGESVKEVEWAKLLYFGNEFVSCGLPVFWCAFDFFENAEHIL